MMNRCLEIYTPDPGECESMDCRICGTQMQVERNAETYRGMAAALSKSLSKCDVFTCLISDESWHRQIKDLMREKDETSSNLISQIIEKEINEIMSLRTPTLDKYAD